MTFELKSRGFDVKNQIPLPLIYKGNYLETELKLDILVNDIVIVELKTVDSFIPIHEAQLLSYLQLVALPKGILINFKCRNIMNEGQKTLVTKRFFDLPDGY